MPDKSHANAQFIYVDPDTELIDVVADPRKGGKPVGY